MESIHSNYHSHCSHNNRLRTLSLVLSCLWSLSLFLPLFPHIPFFFFTFKMCNIINFIPLLYFTVHSVNILWNMMFHHLLAACGSFTGRCHFPSRRSLGIRVRPCECVSQASFTRIATSSWASASQPICQSPAESHKYF